MRPLKLLLLVTSLCSVLPLGSAQTPQVLSASSRSSNNLSPDLTIFQTLLKSPKPITWLFTGDSVTQGAKWTVGSRPYSEIFSERIRWEMRRTRDIVINTAISGNKTTDILNDFDWRVAHLHPDVVSLMIGMNDASLGPDGEKLFEANLHTLIQQVRAAGAIPILQTTNTIQADTHRTDLPTYNEIVRRVATSEKVVLVDNWQYWQQHRTAANLSEWLGNPIHPNSLGHAQIAGELFRTLGINDPDSPMIKLANP